jgi:hypothetical protein
MNQEATLLDENGVLITSTHLSGGGHRRLVNFLAHVSLR